MEVRSKFDKGLNELKNNLMELMNLTKKAHIKAMEALTKYDKGLAVEVIRGDEVINNLEEIINEEAIVLIAKQGPVATDLRRIMTGVKIANDVERIADYATNICEYIIKADNIDKKNVKIIDEINKIMFKMYDQIIKAVDTEDMQLSYKVAEMDTELDTLYKVRIKELYNKLKSATDQEAIDIAQTIIILKYIERAGDHITNIAESIVYLIKGKKYDFN